MKDILTKLKGGEILLCAEYRGSKNETIGYIDKKTGGKAEFRFTSIMVERGGGSSVAVLSVSIPDGETFENCDLKLVKGTNYIFELESFETVKGVAKGRLKAGAKPEIG